ncbi:MAG: metal ABC transporter ATP-binding protein [Actinomycetota bacterium]
MSERVLIRLESASVAYDGLPAVIDADLAINAGDYMGVVGPSGSGKTTLLKLLAAAVAPTDGRAVRVPGLVAGYVPQVESVNWQFPVTVSEVVLMAGDRRRLLPWPSHAERRRAGVILQRLGIDDLERRHIRSLSGGQQQRVFIARALMGSPDVLLMDEPTSGVDVATRHDVLHLLHELNHDDGIAVVITTHDLNGIAAHMHTLVCLNRRIIAAGSPAHILTPAVLEQTYGAPMAVLSHGGMPVVVDHLTAAEGASPLGREHHEHRRAAATDGGPGPAEGGRGAGPA